MDKYTFSMRPTRQTKKTIRHTIDNGDAFQVVELVRLMENALRYPKQRYHIKIDREDWNHRACRNFEKDILSQPHWKPLNFRYSKPSRSFLFCKK